MLLVAFLVGATHEIKESLAKGHDLDNGLLGVMAVIVIRGLMVDAVGFDAGEFDSGCADKANKIHWLRVNLLGSLQLSF